MNTTSRPTAVDPADLHRTLARRFNAGDLEGLLALYEHEATLVREPGVPVSGAKDLRAALAGFLSLSPKQTFVATLGVETAGDLALTRSHWGFHGTNPSDGSSVVIEHFGVEVMRRQPDGSWRFLIDDPFGGDAAAARK
jgi:ketosteroid isomerase-like protein